VPRNGRKWDRRLDRARELAETYQFAKQILLFYFEFTTFQKSTYLQYPSSAASGKKERSSLPATLDAVDLGHLLTRWRAFLAMIESAAPAALAEFARGLKLSPPETVAALLCSVWPSHLRVATETGGEGKPFVAACSLPDAQPNLNPFERFCAQAFLQPFAEFLADHAEVASPQIRRPTCPYCGSSPLVGVLRPEGEGAKRSLICSFCRTEWDYLRIACPACDERREEKLCVYTTPNFAAVRVEACGTCRAYTVTVDLTKHGMAVPEVDALAAIPLTLWADEHGYRQFTRNVLCP
jgi:formate dehydrogenase accessory protein FdhE